MTPSVLSTHSSVRWVFVWLILQCSFLLGEGDCNASRIQCGEVLEALGENPHCGEVAWGGANIVLLCQSSSGRMALRMSLLADSSKKEEHVVSIEDVVSAADRSPNFVEHGLIDLLLAGLGAVGREVPVRRLIRESEFDGEAKWRDRFQWRRLVFPPAIPISTCKLCVVLNTPVKVYSRTSLENRALVGGQNVCGCEHNEAGCRQCRRQPGTHSSDELSRFIDWIPLRFEAHGVQRAPTWRSQRQLAGHYGRCWSRFWFSMAWLWRIFSVWYQRRPARKTKRTPLSSPTFHG